MSLCRIITNDWFGINMNFLPSMNNLISKILQLTEHKYTVQKPSYNFMMMCSLCPIGQCWYVATLIAKQVAYVWCIIT